MQIMLRHLFFIPDTKVQFAFVTIPTVYVRTQNVIMGGADPNGCKYTEDCAPIQFQRLFLNLYHLDTCTFAFREGMKLKTVA